MKIKVSDIENLENKEQKVNFSEIYEEFNLDVPVEATLIIKVLGELIKVTGKIKAKLNLTCDLCLKEFTKDFDFDVEEYFLKDGLNVNNTGEFEISENNFLEDLNGQDEIDLTNFIYQCVILHMPNKLVCDINCKGDENLEKYIKKDFTDPRLEIFKKIKIEKE